MKKVMGEEYADLEARKNFLIDNADKVEELDYHKSFSSEEMDQKKTEFANKSIRIAELEEMIKDYKDNINLELKPLREEAQKLRDDLKAKGQMVKEKCYALIDQEEKMVGYYNAEGSLVMQRPATRDELQKTIFTELRQASNQ